MYIYICIYLPFKTGTKYYCTNLVFHCSIAQTGSCFTQSYLKKRIGVEYLCPLIFYDLIYRHIFT